MQVHLSCFDATTGQVWVRSGWSRGGLWTIAERIRMGERGRGEEGRAGRMKKMKKRG